MYTHQGEGSARCSLDYYYSRSAHYYGRGTVGPLPLEGSHPLRDAVPLDEKLVLPLQLFDQVPNETVSYASILICREGLGPHVSGVLEQRRLFGDGYGL